MRQFSPIEDIISEARNGRITIMVDDDDRENEGDLIIPAQMATPDAINFMARFGRGLICLALPLARVKALGLDMMARENRDPLGTAFTISIEARDGVTTGISAADRARTIAAAIDQANGPSALVSPGHVFPLASREGGVLVRAGHTEAAVDIARLAGLNPSGVICEIMKDDGAMARRDDLLRFAEQHGLKIGTIRDLIAYRCRHDRLIECVDEALIRCAFDGEWRMRVYKDGIAGWEHTVLQKGEIATDRPTLVRMHDLSLLGDTLGEVGPKQFALQRSMRMITEAGSGVIVALRSPRLDVVAYRLRRRREGEDSDLRDYGIGAQILMDMGISKMILITSGKPRHVVGLEGYGLEISGTMPLRAGAEPLAAVDILRA